MTSDVKMSEQNSRVKREPTLAFVIPCYNEEVALHVTAGALKTKIRQLEDSHAIAKDSIVIFVDDGSSDETWNVIEGLHRDDSVVVHGVKLAHNRGHQNALFAGLMRALSLDVDAAVSMDADLQDDPDAVDAMVQEYMQGAEIVYGVRDNRETDTAFKRGTAHAFYALMKWLGTETVPDHADYRLMSRTALQALSQYKESNLFLRGGPFAWIQDGQGVLQERNASCRRVQISAKEDGCFCGGRRDLLLDEAVDDDYRIGFVLGVCWNRNAGLYSRLCFFRACCSRLGIDDVFYVDFRRFHFACARNYW